MSLLVISAAAPASHRGRHRRALKARTVALGVAAVLGGALVLVGTPSAAFLLTVLGLP